LENLGENSLKVVTHPAKAPSGEKGLSKAENLLLGKEGRPVAADD